jgi:TPR repeat protein
MMITMMSKVEVLFFSADPLSALADGTPRLGLDDEMREIQQKMGAAKHQRALKFSWNPAARSDDLLQALRDERPQIVHFSGHGSSDGLVLVSRNGTRAIDVGTGPLGRLFGMFPGDIRVVLLSACFSRPQAEAIAQEVGCAIGTHGEIPDDAAVTFNAAFYRAIASGCSIKAAYEQARIALQMEYSEHCECPDLVVKKGVDPNKIILVSRFPALAKIAAVIAVLAGLVLGYPQPIESAYPIWRGVQLRDCTWVETGTVAPAAASAAASATSTDAAGPAADLAQAKALCQAGQYDEAFPLFESAARAGNAEAMGFLGIAYQSGEGTTVQPDLAIIWLRKAAYARDPRGMIALATAYQGGKEKGYGVERQPWVAREWLEKAVDELGNVEAMLNLARLYLEERKDSLALAVFQRAINAGSVEGIIEIGRMREQGRGGKRDAVLALRLYNQAADRGSPRGLFEVGRIHQDGVGVPRSYAKARTSYLQGACEGSVDAMYQLGFMYLNGLGVKRDRGAAIDLFRRAADGGHALAGKQLAKLDEDKENRIEKFFAHLMRPDSPEGCAVPDASASAADPGAMGSLAAR